MEEKLINIILIGIAAVFVMMWHELPKSIVYCIKSKKKDMRIIKAYKYIDPIGLIFAMTSGCCFSKPYMYRIRNRKTNLLLGITGFISLGVLFVMSIFLFKGYIALNRENMIMKEELQKINLILLAFIYDIAVLSLSMIILNLFPISTFDLGLIIAGKSPNKYFSIIKNDAIIKIIMLICIIFNLIQNITDMFMKCIVGM